MTHFFQYFLDAIIRASAQRETVESCSGGSGGLIRLNASQVIHDFNVQFTVTHYFCGLFFFLTAGFLKTKFESVSRTVCKIRSNFFNQQRSLTRCNYGTASFAVTVLNIYVIHNLNFSIEEWFFSVLKRCAYVANDDFKLQEKCDAEYMPK